jgi:hypothetical protein
MVMWLVSMCLPTMRATKSSPETSELLNKSLVFPAPDVGTMSLRDVASLITTKEARAEDTRAKKGFICQKGHYIGGTLDFATGKLTSLSMPLPSTARVLENKEQPIKERVNANKIIFDS